MPERNRFTYFTGADHASGCPQLNPSSLHAQHRPDEQSLVSIFVHAYEVQSVEVEWNTVRIRSLFRVFVCLFDSIGIFVQCKESFAAY